MTVLDDINAGVREDMEARQRLVTLAVPPLGAVQGAPGDREVKIGAGQRPLLSELIRLTPQVVLAITSSPIGIASCSADSTPSAVTRRSRLLRSRKFVCPGG